MNIHKVARMKMNENMGKLHKSHIYVSTYKKPIPK